jgi:ADP-heptose:LPS heptosyltransferase
LADLALESTDLGVVITGNNDRIGNFDERCVDLNGKTDLEILARVIAGARCFVSGSTGTLHLADALGVGCVSFFVRHPVVGPERWGPRRNMGNILMPDNRCVCEKLSRCTCLEKITPEAALAQLMSIIGGK